MAKIKPFDLDLGNGEKAHVTEVVEDEYDDLDTHPITLGDGTVLDNEAAAEYGEAVAARAAARGRPSLTGRGRRSPQIGVRLPADLDARLRERADAEHKRPSEVVREALAQYLAG